ncbi:tyrosine-type recombinase/integrase [Flavobacterium sp. CF136]|uniref:tyrosine-type recombinase/integrase n=1 Tax=Flavobacterium sp. (strain CF136) TaxID=1144313 RepID=UPI0002718E49|nr:site-specific integrase [Flavobacterium sp. CF136]EJL62818.1 site-specific recombinase XerD [Flavobacterium sp. CF136]
MKKTSVTLRQKVISRGKISLYLDYYPPILNHQTNEYTRREFLKLYLYEKPLNQIQKISNIEISHTAELIRIRKQNELYKDAIYSAFEKEQMEIQKNENEPFLKYFKKAAEKKEGNNYQNWNCSIIHFESFLKGRQVAFKDITVSFIEDFKYYLLKAKSLRDPEKTLSRNTALSYHNKIKATLKLAHKEGKLRKDINASVDSIKEQESQRNFLTHAEAKKLFSTPCSNDIVYRISVFSVMTGLRYSDIAKLTWAEIEYIENDGYYIRFKQKKTEGLQTMPISEQAFEILGIQGENEKVFHGLKKWEVDRVLPVWVARAGIMKHITFHCFRHTYATLQVSSGTDIFTLSKMLGHKSVKTTQIYAKIIDEKKRETTSRISFI